MQIFVEGEVGVEGHVGDMMVCKWVMVGEHELTVPHLRVYLVCGAAEERAHGQRRLQGG